MLVVKPRAAVAWCLAAFTAYTVRVCYTLYGCVHAISTVATLSTSCTLWVCWAYVQLFLHRYLSYTKNFKMFF